ncbi:carbohydrate-selective porin OprB [Pseudomonas sp. M47T1]|uniref:carbohydrate porin n=1 Tax=unclassified Pseudomonas TaxID=196821 RepID=UPI000260839D|nr:carbohydrate porin [Pseudomonas sp. M47T1]EIK93625.1 carbohydrate-selective porin OprB [Pseudomonas sp. M47T1]
MLIKSSRCIKTSSLVAGLSLGSLMVAVPGVAQADDSLMTGNWGGERTRLENEGIKITSDYVSETFGTVHGGESHGARYAQQLRIGARFDLSKILGIDNGGTVQVMVTDRRGNSASNDLVGNRLPVQEIYGGQYTRISEVSYERTIFTPNLDMKVGFMPMGNDFGGMSILTNFVNAGFCAHPLSMSGGSGWTNAPTGHWGGMLKYKINDEWAIQTAAFEVNPITNSESKYALRMSPDHYTGTIMPIELIYTHAGEYDGQYKFGWYYDTSDTARIDHNGTAAGRSGSYVLADQSVWHSATDPKRNLHVFGQATQTDVATSPFHHWYSAGVVLHKPFDSRPDDAIGLAYGRAVLNPHTRDNQIAAASTAAAADDISNLDSGEQLIELSYTAQVTKWLTVRPDVQYIKEPGAFYGVNTQNALMAGVQIKAAF